MTAEKPKIRTSVQGTFVLLFSAFIAVTLVMLNTFPTVSSRDLVFSAKRSALLSQAGIMSSSLSALERLGADGVDAVMALVDVNEFDRVLVTDGEGTVLYDTARQGKLNGTVCDFPQVQRALGGVSAEFYCKYDGDAFFSRCAVPVMSYGRVIGAVYISDLDADQAAIISSIRSRLGYGSLIAGAVMLLAVAVFSRALTRRLRGLVSAMHYVREGNYAYRVPLHGSDEVTELQSEFNDMTARLQSTEELRRRFVSDASHELRTPLASIRLLSDSVVQNADMDEETMREFVTDIGQEAERLQRLTEKLMMLTKKDGGVQSEKEPVNLKKVAERAIHLLNPLAAKRGVRIFTELAGDCIIWASADDIYQIIFNLAENAIKYNSFDGNVFLRLERRGAEAVLTVEDTGIGIPEEDLPRIFDRFYRVDKARSRASGGAGLGLSIVHDAAAANGGTIRAERRETVGTRFTVSFPLWEDDGSNNTKESDA